MNCNSLASYGEQIYDASDRLIKARDGSILLDTRRPEAVRKGLKLSSGHMAAHIHDIGGQLVLVENKMSLVAKGNVVVMVALHIAFRLDIR